MGISRLFRDATVEAEGLAPVREESFRQFIERVNPRFRVYGYHRLLLDVCEAVVRGECPWLIVCQPPGTSKSEVFSRLLPSYLVSQRPSSHVAVCTYGAMLAHGLTRDAREYAVEAGVALHKAQRAKTSWRTTSGGHVWGAGFGGGVRGNRYHLGVVDDPHKGPQELLSPLRRDALYRWWEQTWLNRGFLINDQPVSRIIVMQRLADNDLVGWLLQRPDSDKWSVLALDAVRDTETPMPVGRARLLPDPRTHGELLVPEHLTHEVLDNVAADPDTLAAQYQQRPVRTSGQMFRREWFPVVEMHQVPLLVSRVAGGDLAVSTRQSADYTCVFAAGLGVDGRIYLLPPLWDRMQSPQARQMIAGHLRRWGCPYLAMEAPALGLGFTQELRAMPEMAGVTVVDSMADRDKVSRAWSWSPLAAQGKIVLVNDGGGWVERFFGELLRFPGGTHDDAVDAVGHTLGGLRLHAQTSAPGSLWQQEVGPARQGWGGR